MRKIYAFLMFFLLATFAGQAWAGTYSVSWANSNSDRDYVITQEELINCTNTTNVEGLTYSEITNVYRGQYLYGLRLGVGDKTGTLTFNFNPALGSVTKITLKTKRYGANTGQVTVSVNGTAVSTFSPESAFSKQEITLPSITNISTITIATTSRPAYIQDLTFTTGVAAPVFTVAEGTYTTAQTVKVTDETFNSTDYTYYYTTDGSDPTESSTCKEYTDNTTGIQISSTTTLKMVAKENNTDNYSAVTSATYTFSSQAISMTLAGLVAAGSKNDFDNEAEYTISNDLQVVAMYTDASNNVLLLKDSEQAALGYMPVEQLDAAASAQGVEIVDYPLNAFGYFNDEQTTQSYYDKSQHNYDQNNWIEVVVSNDVANAVAVNDTIAGGSITGKYVNAINPRMESSVTSVEKKGTAQAYTRQAYSPANFYQYVQEGSDQSTWYFFMPPKRNELVQIVWAVYMDGKFYCPKATTDVNAQGIVGLIENINYDYNESSQPNLKDGYAYQFQAVVKAVETSGGGGETQTAPRKTITDRTFGIENAQSSAMSKTYTIYPLNLAHNDRIVTGIDGVNEAKGVTRVRYYNLQGVELSEMQDGINIIVTHYTDGSHTTMKIRR